MNNVIKYFLENETNESVEAYYFSEWNGHRDLIQCGLHSSQLASKFRSGSECTQPSGS